MGKKYYVHNRQQDGSGYNHEVHKEGCPWMPYNAEYLGEFDSAEDALREAKKKFSDADGCARCCPEINHDKRGW